MNPSRIEDLIEQAREAYIAYEPLLKHAVKEFMEETLKAVEKSRVVFQRLGVSEICRQCDKEEGGSCCGAGIEYNYTVPLLIANMLAGVNLPISRFDEKSCYFLGPKGCMLLFRHTLCVNFFCKKLYDLLGAEQIVLLQMTIGDEIDLTFKLCEAIYKIMQTSKKP
ncbi:MAG: hypothetical protein WHS38_01955 [Thermodesulforhabdaceae bacterium]|jgi:hypothetical protein